MHPTCTEGEQGDEVVNVFKFEGRYDITTLKNKKNKTKKTIELFEQIKRHSD